MDVINKLDKLSKNEIIDVIKDVIHIDDKYARIINACMIKTKIEK